MLSLSKVTSTEFRSLSLRSSRRGALSSSSRTARVRLWTPEHFFREFSILKTRCYPAPRVMEILKYRETFCAVMVILRNRMSVTLASIIDYWKGFGALATSYYTLSLNDKHPNGNVLTIFSKHKSNKFPLKLCIKRFLGISYSQ